MGPLDLTWIYEGSQRAGWSGQYDRSDLAGDECLYLTVVIFRPNKILWSFLRRKEWSCLRETKAVVWVETGGCHNLVQEEFGGLLVKVEEGPEGMRTGQCESLVVKLGRGRVPGIHGWMVHVYMADEHGRK